MWPMIGEQLCATVRFQLPAVIQKDGEVLEARIMNEPC